MQDPVLFKTWMQDRKMFWSWRYYQLMEWKGILHKMKWISKCNIHDFDDAHNTMGLATLKSLIQGEALIKRYAGIFLQI